MRALERQDKLAFLAGLDVLSVPTVYRDPKGIFVLEALASGVPVVQPDHGSFPELIAATRGGRLVRPCDADHLAHTLYELLTDHSQRLQLGETGRTAVQQEFSAEKMAAQMLEVFRGYVPRIATATMKTTTDLELAK